MPDQAATRSRTDQNNSTFWNELCGTQLAKSLGIVDDSIASLKKFDDWYFDYYPYLTTHIPFDDVNRPAGFGSWPWLWLSCSASC